MKYYKYVIDLIEGEDGSMIINNKYITQAEAKAIHNAVENTKAIREAKEDGIQCKLFNEIMNEE